MGTQKHGDNERACIDGVFVKRDRTQQEALAVRPINASSTMGDVVYQIAAISGCRASLRTFTNVPVQLDTVDAPVSGRRPIPQTDWRQPIGALPVEQSIAERL